MGADTAQKICQVRTLKLVDIVLQRQQPKFYRMLEHRLGSPEVGTNALPAPISAMWARGLSAILEAAIGCTDHPFNFAKRRCCDVSLEEVMVIQGAEPIVMTYLAEARKSLCRVYMSPLEVISSRFYRARVTDTGKIAKRNEKVGAPII